MNNESSEQNLEKPEKELPTSRGDADNKTREDETSVTALVTPEARLPSTRDRKKTEKGLEYELEIATKNRNAAQSKLTIQIKKIYSFLHNGIDQHSLEIERNTLDSLKEEFNETHASLNNLSPQESKDALYQYFDLRDREYMECRARICERLHEQERAISNTKSVQSFKSRSSRSSRCSRQSALSKQLEAETRAAKLAIELQYLEQDTAVRKMKLQKEAALAIAEASAANRFLRQITEDDDHNAAPSPKPAESPHSNDAKWSQTLPQDIKRELDKCEENDSLTHGEKNEVPLQGAKSSKDQTARGTIERNDTRDYSPPSCDVKKEDYSPLYDIKNENVGTPWYFKKENYDTRRSVSERTGPPSTEYLPVARNRFYNDDDPTEKLPVGPGNYGFGFGERTFQELIKLQEKQTELSAMIVNQQRKSALPVQEPPTFSGDFLDYPIFVQAFEAIIEDKVDTDKDRLYFLNKFTTGKANDVVKSFVTLNTQDGYKQARKLLAQRFGNPHHVAEAYKSRLRKWPRISDEDGTKLQEFSDFLVRCKEAMETLKYMDELNSSETLITISAKLPPYAGVKWCRHARELQMKTGAAVSFKNLVEFIREESELANDPVFSPSVLKRERNKTLLKEPTSQRYPQRRAPGASTLLTSSASSQINKSATPSKPQCPLCKKGHGLEECKSYLDKEVKHRVEFIRSSGLCFGCLRKGHLSKNCKKRLKCETCGKSHPTSIHDPNVKNESASESPSEQSSVEGTTSRTIATDSVTNSMILPVWLHHRDHPEREVMVYALLDNASDTTFIKSSVLESLDLKGPEMTLKLYTMHGRADIAVQKIEGLLVNSFDKSAQVELPKTYSRDNIPFRRNQIPTPQTAKEWPHLKTLEHEIKPYDSDIDVGLLIGCNCPRALKPREVIPGAADDPYAVRTLLGWGIIGPVTHHKKAVKEDENAFTSHRILCSEVGNERQVSDKFSSTVRTKEVVNPLDVKAILEADFKERDCSNTLAPSREDRQFLAIVSEGIEHLSNGHYELPLPLKPQKKHLPNNREMAVHRLKHLRKRMESDTKYKEDYTAFMKNMIDQGHAEKVPDEEISTTKATWFIPHHGVYHPKKQKIRVVFDCSAQYRGESLNKHLLQGPDLTNSLVGVLCRFREEPVAFICDVEGMFHQVQVKCEHRDLLRFLWWEDGDTHKTPEEYRMTVHLFGATSSPGCANFAFKSTADDHEEEMPAAAEFLRKNFYVDDGLKSVATTEEAIKLIEDAREMCQKGGFNLHKFISNDKKVIASVPIACRAEDVKALDLSQDILPIERALGVQWCVENDHFNFRVVLDDRPTTRRGILSTVSSVFDPLGFVAPFVLEGKRILQELCRDKVGWDDPVTEEVKSRWLKWKDGVHALAKLTVERCYKPADFGPVVERELHHFSDASIKGYGQCSYIRLVNDRGDTHCSFVMGKARVTPLKPITIPRLELTAALISTRISEQIKTELQLQNVPETFWTDSKVVLGYLNNDSRRFHIFVANRVQEIQERTSPSQWRYVNTENNPADDASRGLTANQLENSRWIKGPEFLWKPKDQWPQENQDVAKTTANELPRNDPEIKKVTALATTSADNFANLRERLEYFSSWYRAKKAVALCIRYVRKVRQRVTEKEKLSSKVATRRTPLTVEEMKQAEIVILRAAQSHSFKVCKENVIPNEEKNNTLNKLDPFVDNDGIIRVGGRLRLADLQESAKFPAILPKNGHVTTLIIKHYHERLHHQGRSSTLNEVRSNGYWVIGGTSSVGSLIHDCVTCRKLRGVSLEQKMADLPQDRLEPAPPFSYCAVDFFGPFLVKQGRKEIKRYGALFTCMATRAIHLEVSASLETDSFLNALRRFLCRRGPTRQLRCDQGTNLVGARNELKKCIAELDHDKINSELLKVNCDWFTFKLNTPTASHMGGVWERQIKSVRSVLQALLESNGKQLDEESLNTFLCEAEAVVNSRPLSVDSLNDPDSLDPLTPNHLLTLKTKILLPPPGKFQAEDLYSKKRWRRVQHLSNEFWSRWRKEYLLTLQQRNKWTRQRTNLEVGDIVMIKDQDLPRNKWELGRVTKTKESQDGNVRSVQLRLADSALSNDGKRTKSTRMLERPIQKLVLLLRDPQRFMKIDLNDS